VTEPTRTPKPRAAATREGSERSRKSLAALNDDALVQQGSIRPVVITGGAGFIGTNLAHRLLTQGYRVILFDNLSRRNVEENVRWLTATHGDKVMLERGDVRDRAAVRNVVADAYVVFHFAAQVAVTTSLVDPRYDFEVNVGGTLNVLEALRSLASPPPLVFTSTNKVYGALADVSLIEHEARYEPLDLVVRGRGVGERRALDFHSPYGCSKGAADQYVLDYARSFDLTTVVFRMSCIYGPHQFGTEDQGWVAHFILQALSGRPLVLFGDGKQVRDILFVEDLVDALLLAWANAERLRGHAFNIGGGPANTTSLLELIELIAALQGSRPTLEHSAWRTGDQRYYVSDHRGFKRTTGWSPQIDIQAGVTRLYSWLADNRRAAAAAVKKVAP
jgi:CDP-paratose 2-epimerase